MFLLPLFLDSLNTILLLGTLDLWLFPLRHINLVGTILKILYNVINYFPTY